MIIIKKMNLIMNMKYIKIKSKLKKNYKKFNNMTHQKLKKFKN